jgi:osmotically-inducible protein OsmY
VKEGRVSLEGTVPTRSMKHQIEDLADYTAGVTDVDNRIRVERAGSGSVSNAPQSVSSSKTTKQ